MYKYSLKHILRGFREDFDQLLKDLIQAAEEEGLPLSETDIQIINAIKEREDEKD